MSSFTLGCIEYINALPLYFPLREKKIPLHNDFHFTFAIPSKLNEMWHQNLLDSVLSSSLISLSGEHPFLPDYGISTEREVLSVNLYTKASPTSLNRARVGVTHHSATSVILLKILCHHFWKVEPAFEPLDRQKPYSHYEGILLIGDEALRSPLLPGFQTIDLGSAWYAMTQLPFVYALFCIRKEIDPEKISLLKEALNSSLLWSQTHLEQIVEVAQKQCNLPTSSIHHYFSLLKYRLSQRELEGLNLFKQLSKNYV